MIMDHDCIRIAEGDAGFARLGLGAYAARYQQAGYAVLALEVAGKRPHWRFEQGVSWATAYPEVLDAVWGRHPDAGVGVATGQRSRLVVIDIDVKGREDGMAAFGSWLMAQHGQPPLPVDVMTSTPSGGRHIWLRTPPGVVVPGRIGILPGVDIKASGGYVAVPPTRIWVSGSDGKVRLPYRWISGCPCSVPMAPPWLLDWISTAVGTGEHATGAGTGTLPALDVDGLQAGGAARGSRNVLAYRYACRLFAQMRCVPGSRALVRESVKRILPDRDGFPDSEVELVISSAESFVARSMEQTRSALADYRTVTGR